MAKRLAHLDARPVIRSWILLISLLAASFIFSYPPRYAPASVGAPSSVQLTPREELNLTEEVPSAPEKAAHAAIAEWMCAEHGAGNAGNACTAVLEMVARVTRAATEFNIPAEIALGIVLKESKFNPLAVNSRSGDYGLMQVNYRWHRDKVATRHELLDPDVNLNVGMGILQGYANREGGNWARALRRYNGLGGKNNYPAEVLALAAHIRKIAEEHEG